MKSIAKILLVVLLIISIIGFVTYAIFMKFVRDVLIEEWFTSSSDGGIYTIEVVKLGSPFSFGSQELIIYADGKELCRTSISNDGKTLDRSNYAISWDNNIAILELKGEESAETITITFENDSPTYRIKQGIRNR